MLLQRTRSSRDESAVRFHLDAAEDDDVEAQQRHAHVERRPSMEMHAMPSAIMGAVTPGNGPSGALRPGTSPEARASWHTEKASAQHSAHSGARFKQLASLGRSYSAASRAGADDAPCKPADCFAEDYLETPLLTRGASSDTAQHLFGTPPPRLHLSWQGITQHVPAPTPDDKNARKRILCNVSGRAYCGELLAVMGPSGSGKTSLLSLLAGGWRKAREAGNLEGDILVNGKPSTKRMKRFVAMVAQDDLLFANLTVEQTLRYAALLNLPKELTREEKLDRVQKVIELLGLKKARNTHIGGPFSRGISGGERKRTSVAHELLSNPSLILADEPTSGLDSTTAARLISTFRSLARGGRAVVCSIHQPSSQIVELFDKVLLLAQGRTIFYGSTQQVISYFNNVGLTCKPYYNPADFMLEIVSDLTHESIEVEERAEEKRLGKVASQNGAAGEHTNGKQTNGLQPHKRADADDHTASDPAAPENTKDGIDLEKGVAATLLKGTLPEPSFDVGAGAAAAAGVDTTTAKNNNEFQHSNGDMKESDIAEQVMRRLPILWSRISADVLELEDTTRQAQIKEQDKLQEEVTSGQKNPSPRANGQGQQALTLTAEEKQLADASLDSESGHANRWPLTWWQQFTLLLSRSFLQHKGERITALYATQVIGIAIVVSLVWFQTPRRADTLSEQTGALFFIVIFWSFTPLFNALTSFPSERAIIIKERAGGSYRLSAYFLAKTLAEMPVELLYPLAFIIIAYFMVGFVYTAGGFFFFLLTLLLGTLCAQSFGLLISCALLDFKKSITFASVSMLTLMLLSGFYVKLQQIPVWLRWVSFACFPKYAYNILAFIQFEPYDFPCADGATNAQPVTGVTFSSCPVKGSEVMSQFDFDLLPLWADIIILVALTLIFRTAAYVALRKTTQP